MAKLRVVFAGTPEFSVPALDTLIDHPATDVVAVYTQPDRPAGRGRKLQASPVKRRALEADIPVRQPISLRPPEVRAQLEQDQADLMVVVAYGLILPAPILALPRLGCWNLHASLLPRWRGAAPIQRAILAGDPETGVCLMQMDAGLDTGPVLSTRRVPIEPDDTAGSLHDKLAEVGADLLGEAMADPGGMQPVPQVGEPTYARKIDKNEAELDWNQPATSLWRQVRAFSPWPGARARLAGQEIKIWSAVPLEGPSSDAVPGQIVAADRNGIVVATGDGALRLLELQKPGARRVSAADYVNAHPQLSE
ncbi:MAG: methionyl-tRNA formyltransferase [Xanthomonadales bacterium]|nr:methionyl-tRNA formyltransferase [Xanthomonadales bacterium]